MERLGTDECPCTSLPEAKRLLRDLKGRLDNVEVSARKKSLLQLLDRFEIGETTKEGDFRPPILKGAEATLEYKKRYLKTIREKFPVPLHTRVGDVSAGDIADFMANYNGRHSSMYNQVLSLLRDIFGYAVKSKMIDRSPVEETYQKRTRKNKRLTPSWDEFERIVAHVRSQKYADTAKASADLIEFMGSAGLGQAECAGLKWGHINFTSGLIVLIRKKTGEEFTIPIYPQVRALIERLNLERGEESGASDLVFGVKDAKKALASACRALGLPAYSARSFRRMFVTRCLELGVNVKVIASWQGHGDGGKLILQEYSHVRTPHEADMAALLVPPSAAPNVIPMPKEAVA